MLSIVLLRPIFSTYITELMSTAARHMITPLIFLNDKMTLFTLPIVKIVLKKCFFKSFTVAFMELEEALRTKLCLASIANCFFLL
jgi:hypothetical protein